MMPGGERPGSGLRSLPATVLLEPEYDVIVVGARVAGASVAMLLAQRGHRVLLLDRASMPSDVVSTHAVLRSGVLQLTRWGLLEKVIAAGTPPIKDITLGFGDERIRFEVKAEYGVDTLYAPRRHVLDGIILEAAISAGAEFRGGTRVTGLAQDTGGTVRGVVVERDHQELEIGARMVVGADGVWSRMAELVGAREYRSHPPTNAVHYAYFSNIESDGFWFQFTPGVNAGVITTNDGLSCVFVGRPTGLVGRFRDDPDTEFARLLRQAGPDLAALAAAGTRETPFRGTNGLPGFVRQPWGSGWALVGDAGYTKDPISAHGISDALRDAELCARAVHAALEDPTCAVAALEEYHRERDALSLGMFEESEALAAYGWDADEASARMRLISDAVRAECAYLEALPEWAPLLSGV
jgi:2-polyprenyl-6-methoxyphenol hydroxylase-like FAD-dependent oxidoreductase